jgi:hypothetical protein
VYYATQVRPKPPTRPTLWWIENDPPCEYGYHLKGDAPPKGRELACVDLRDHKVGWQTVFNQDGKVTLETHWSRNREVGPRLEWDPVTYDILRKTALKTGKEWGESVEWLSDGGEAVVTYRAGDRDGPTWRLDDRHQVLFLENWRAGVRDGRSCAWRDGAWVEQVWRGGKPESGEVTSGAEASPAAP